MNRGGRGRQLRLRKIRNRKRDQIQKESRRKNR